MTGVGEFELIEQLFANLAGPGGFSLKDDAAILSPTPGHDLVLTKDAIAEGRHYLTSDPPGDVARKLIRVNLSDLAAKGARPRAYLLSCAWGRGIDYVWIEAFCAGLKADQELYGIELLGGDTIRVEGPSVLSLTAIGDVSEGQMVRRSGAKIGDDVYVTGGIGEAALGLRVATGKLSLPQSDADALLQRYRVPVPPVSFGRALSSFANASIDISDGLLADLGHLCEASGVGVEIRRESVPVSQAVASALQHDDTLWTLVLTGGDDYQILFTADAERARDIEAAALRTATQVTRIGRIVPTGISVLDADGQPMSFAAKGFQHF
ncbi:MAG: thiamine-phosphate kinase [Parvibaculum sp.]